MRVHLSAVSTCGTNVSNSSEFGKYTYRRIAVAAKNRLDGPENRKAFTLFRNHPIPRRRQFFVCRRGGHGVWTDGMMRRAKANRQYIG